MLEYWIKKVYLWVCNMSGSNKNCVGNPNQFMELYNFVLSFFCGYCLITFEYITEGLRLYITMVWIVNNFIIVYLLCYMLYI